MKQKEPWLEKLQEHQNQVYHALTRVATDATSDQEIKQKIRHLGLTLERVVRHHRFQEGFSLLNPRTWSLPDLWKLFRDTAIAYIQTDSSETFLQPLTTLYEYKVTGNPLPFDDIVALAYKLPNPKKKPLATTNALLVLADTQGYISIDGTTKAQRGRILTDTLEFLPEAKAKSYSAEQVKEYVRTLISRTVTPQFFETNADDQAFYHYTVPINEMYLLHITAMTDKGLQRSGNEDNCLGKAGLLALTDGMGGHDAGEVASKQVCDTIAITTLSPNDRYLIDLLKKADSELKNYFAKKKLAANSGTTVVIAHFRPDGTLSATHAGDSRLYVHNRTKPAGTVPGTSLEQLTEDHSYVWGEMRVWDQYQAGDPRPKEAARTHPHINIITNSIYTSELGSLDKCTQINRPISAGERYLLCSDGLSDLVPDTEIEEILARQTDDGQAAQELVAAAKRYGGKDNITVILATVEQTKVYLTAHQLEEKIAAAVTPALHAHETALLTSRRHILHQDHYRLLAEAKAETIDRIVSVPTEILPEITMYIESLVQDLVQSYSATSDQSAIRGQLNLYTEYFGKMTGAYDMIVRAYAAVVEKALHEKDLESVREFVAQLDILYATHFSVQQAIAQALPSLSHLHYKAALLHFDEGEYPSVHTLLDNIDESAQEPNTEGSLALLRAKTYFATGNLDEAVVVFEKARDKKEQHKYNTQGFDELPTFFAKIIELYYPVISQSRHDPSAYKNTLRALFAKSDGTPHETEAEYAKYVIYQAQQVDATNAVIELGLEYYGHSKLFAAEFILAKLVADGSANPFVYDSLAQVVREQNVGNAYREEREEWVKWLDWKSKELSAQSCDSKLP